MGTFKNYVNESVTGNISSSRGSHLVNILNILIKLCFVFRFVIVQLLQKE